MRTDETNPADYEELYREYPSVEMVSDQWVSKLKTGRKGRRNGIQNMSTAGPCSK